MLGMKGMFFLGRAWVLTRWVLWRQGLAGANSFYPLHPFHLS